VLERVITMHEKKSALIVWRLNATKMRASALAVWAVDQGNRKACPSQLCKQSPARSLTCVSR
jgi:hypothetical protein